MNFLCGCFSRQRILQGPIQRFSIKSFAACLTHSTIATTVSVPWPYAPLPPTHLSRGRGLVSIFSLGTILWEAHEVTDKVVMAVCTGYVQGDVFADLNNRQVPSEVMSRATAGDDGVKTLETRSMQTLLQLCSKWLLEGYGPAQSDSAAMDALIGWFVSAQNFFVLRFLHTFFMYMHVLNSRWFDPPKKNHLSVL